MPPSWVIRIRVPTAVHKQKALYSKPMSWSAAKAELVKYTGRGHRADVVELTPAIEAEIRRQTL